MAGLDVISLGVDLGSTMADIYAEEADLETTTENGGVNIVGSGINGLVDMVDAISDGAASVRDGAGKAIHDALSSVPVVGGLLGTATDAAGVLVDAAGGIVSEAKNLGQGVASIVETGGSVLLGTKYERSDYKTGQKQEEGTVDARSFQETVREDGIISGTVGWVMNQAGGFIADKLGIGADGEDGEEGGIADTQSFSETAYGYMDADATSAYVDSMRQAGSRSPLAAAFASETTPSAGAGAGTQASTGTDYQMG